MSYYFSIIGSRDNPIFEIDFGTSKIGGDGVARFREEAKHMNQFIVHSALDVVEDAQWSGNVKFMLLMNPDPAATAYSSFQTSPPSRPATARQSTLIANNPTSQQTEEAVRQFMLEVYEAWMKCIMNPFYATDQPVTSPIFRSRVSTAAKKYL
ncbi:related to sedlin [Ramularia collo-cygni]|uniref:Related to sedlin n=1 Tax=Ramularia collo-cygni TaxID=112498 RepID=A0A2D3VPT9_9PEZI|nr:related to sedlin [Ramularia collo-cygni]CZT25174.1 related to sedlin [Ramularia collo-cygni]